MDDEIQISIPLAPLIEGALRAAFADYDVRQAIKTALVGTINRTLADVVEREATALASDPVFAARVRAAMEAEYIAAAKAKARAAASKASTGQLRQLSLGTGVSDAG
jgi:hypothetical protein